MDSADLSENELVGEFRQSEHLEPAKATHKEVNMEYEGKPLLLSPDLMAALPDQDALWLIEVKSRFNARRVYEAMGQLLTYEKAWAQGGLRPSSGARPLSELGEAERFYKIVARQEWNLVKIAVFGSPATILPAYYPAKTDQRFRPVLDAQDRSYRLLVLTLLDHHIRVFMTNDSEGQLDFVEVSKDWF